MDHTGAKLEIDIDIDVGIGIGIGIGERLGEIEGVVHQHFGGAGPVLIEWGLRYPRHQIMIALP